MIQSSNLITYSNSRKPPVRRKLSHHKGRQVCSEKSNWDKQQQLAYYGTQRTKETTTYQEILENIR